MMNEFALLIICGIIILYWFGVTLKCIVAQKRIDWLAPSSATIDGISKISVIIPARNEDKDLAASLDSVLKQDGVELEVIVVNDHSSDRTGEIIDEVSQSDPRLKAIHNPPLTPGWLGKCNAMQHGAALATGDFFLFTDADIIHARDCFATVLYTMQQDNLDFISLFPLFDNQSFWENINIPIYFFGLAKLLATPGLNDPNSSNAVASGALMLIKAEVFKDIGGFNDVKAEMLDDVGLARLLKKQNYRVGYRLAPDCLQVRLFKSNRDAFWGTTKNILVAVEDHIWLAIPLIILAIFQNWAPLVAIAVGVIKANGLLIIFGAGSYGIQYLSFFFVRRLMHFRALKALFYPLVVVVATCCMIRALVYHMRGAILWRGRKISVRV